MLQWHAVNIVKHWYLPCFNQAPSIHLSHHVLAIPLHTELCGVRTTCRKSYELYNAKEFKDQLIKDN